MPLARLAAPAVVVALALAVVALGPGAQAGASATAAAAEQAGTVRIDVRYRLLGAEAVWLLWGLDGWRVPPGVAAPTGSRTHRSAISTPMVAEDGAWIARIDVPVGSTVDYAFHAHAVEIGVGAGGAPDLWDGGPDGRATSRLGADRSRVVVVESAAAPWVGGELAADEGSGLVARRIRYRNPEAGRVDLLWRVEAWRPTDPAAPRRQLGDDRLSTPLANDGDAWSATLLVPAGADLSYAFHLTQNRAGQAADSWDWDTVANDAYLDRADGPPVREIEASAASRSYLSVRDFSLGRRWIGLAAVCGLVGAALIAPLWWRRVRGLAPPWLRSPTVSLLAFAVAFKVVLLAVGLLALGVMSRKVDGLDYVGLGAAHPRQLLPALWRGDPGWYLDIAVNGYRERPFTTETKENWGFYPLWPLVLRAAALLPRIDLVGVAVSSLLFLAGVALLYHLCLLDVSRGLAARAVALYTLYPASYLALRPGPESLFVLLSVASFLGMRSGRPLVAGVLAALAAATRPQGVLLLLPLGVLAYGRWRDGRASPASFAPLLLVPLAVAAFMLHLYVLTGNADAYAAIQDAQWQQGLAYPLAAMAVFLTEPYLLHYYGLDLTPVNFLFALGAIVLTVAMVRMRSLPPAYVLYSTVAVLLTVSRRDLDSSLRYMLPIFPLFLGLALLTARRPLVFLALAAIFAALQAFYVVGFVLQFDWAMT